MLRIAVQSKNPLKNLTIIRLAIMRYSFPVSLINQKKRKQNHKQNRQCSNSKKLV